MILDYLVTKTTTTINYKWKEQKNKKKNKYLLLHVSNNGIDCKKLIFLFVTNASRWKCASVRR